jgi:hypothetical protein
MMFDTFCAAKMNSKTPIRTMRGQREQNFEPYTFSPGLFSLPLCKMRARALQSPESPQSFRWRARRAALRYGRAAFLARLRWVDGIAKLDSPRNGYARRSGAFAVDALIVTCRR